jgi:ParB family chromosome partitioning protein
MPVKKPALGRGLDSLFGGSASAAVMAPPAANEKSPLRQLPVDEIRPNPFQPRTHFNSEKLDELAASIREKGVLQPIVVREFEEGFQIVAGERRWRAAQRAGLLNIPALIGEFTEREMVEAALIENIQRDDLDPIEEASAYHRLIKEFGLTQESLAESLGKSRASVANAVRLLKLPKEVQSMVSSGELTAGHARTLLSISTAESQLALARRIASGGLTVREVEKIAQGEQPKKKQSSAKQSTPSSDNLSDIQEKLCWKLGLKVKVHSKTDRSGRVEVHYETIEEFQQFCEQVGLALD